MKKHTPTHPALKAAAIGLLGAVVFGAFNAVRRDRSLNSVPKAIKNRARDLARVRASRRSAVLQGRCPLAVAKATEIVD